MQINKISSGLNFGALIVDPQSVQFLEKQPKGVQNRFLRGQEELKNTNHWDLVFKNNKFNIVGKYKYDGFELGEKFDVISTYDGAVLRSNGRVYPEPNNKSKVLSFKDFIIGEASPIYVNEINQMPRIDKAIAITKLMDRNSYRNEMGVTLLGNEIF